MLLFRLSNLQLAFGDNPLLDGVSLTIHKGERIGILGQNGAGKSTFMKVLMGEIIADSGELWRAESIRVAYLDQNLPAQDEQTIYDYIAGGIEGRGDILKRYHAQLADFYKEDAQALAHLHVWVFVPLTLWPFSITDLLHQCLQQVEKGQPLHPQLRLAINLIPDVPDETVCETVAEHERQVQRGNYENVVNTYTKGPLYVVYTADEISYKHPIDTIWRIVEGYGYHGRPPTEGELKP
jgi:energy-coupling factor transporter ATP-binding protein EcfA2